VRRRDTSGKRILPRSEPSPVPLRLVKAPERDTLSPRERADIVRARDGTKIALIKVF
jgi:hypothetical protein